MPSKMYGAKPPDSTREKLEAVYAEAWDQRQNAGSFEARALLLQAMAIAARGLVDLEQADERA